MQCKFINAATVIMMMALQLSNDPIAIKSSTMRIRMRTYNKSTLKVSPRRRPAGIHSHRRRRRRHRLAKLQSNSHSESEILLQLLVRLDAMAIHRDGCLSSSTAAGLARGSTVKQALR